MSAPISDNKIRSTAHYYGVPRAAKRLGLTEDAVREVCARYRQAEADAFAASQRATRLGQAAKAARMRAAGMAFWEIAQALGVRADQAAGLASEGAAQ